MKRIRRQRGAVKKTTSAAETSGTRLTRVPTRVNNGHCRPSNAEAPKCQLSIELNQPDGVYYVGQKLEGAVVVEADVKMEILGLELRLYGGSFVRWVTKRTLHGHGAGEEHSGEEVYFNNSHALWGKVRGVKDEEPETLSVGRHLFPFSRLLPEDVPSAFDGQHGWVRYYALCTLYLPGCRPGCHTTYSNKVFFTVINPLDLNVEKPCLIPAKQQKDLMLTTPMCKTGRVSCTLSLPRSGFVPGEHLQADVDIHNMSARKVKNVQVSLRQIVRYGATDSDETKQTSWELGQVRGDSVKPGKHQYWTTRGLVIPPVAPSRLDECKFIDVKYEAQLHVDVPPHSLTISVPVTIGTVPTVEAFLTIWKYKEAVFRPNRKKKTSKKKLFPTNVVHSCHVLAAEDCDYLPMYKTYRVDLPGTTMLTLTCSPAQRRRSSVRLLHFDALESVV